MLLVIDAYNFLKTKHMQTFLQPTQIQKEITYFVQYAKWRGNEITLIFDGGESLYEYCEQVHPLVRCCYSGTLQTADDMIKTLVQRSPYQHGLLVTSDREIREYAHARNVVTIASCEFGSILQQLMMQRKQKAGKRQSAIHKTTTESNEYLDQLMEQGSRDIDALFQSEQHDQSIYLPIERYEKKNKRLFRKLQKL